MTRNCQSPVPTENASFRLVHFVHLHLPVATFQIQSAAPRRIEEGLKSRVNTWQWVRVFPSQVVQQKLVEPSFFLTMMMGEDHALAEGSVIPCFIIVSTSTCAFVCFPSGNRRGNRSLTYRSSIPSVYRMLRDADARLRSFGE